MLAQTTAIASGIAINQRYARAKRILDIVLTIIIILLTGVVMAIVAVAIMLDSDGPVIFRQTRIGKDGAEFEMFKFRSMYHGVDDKAHRDAIVRYMHGERISEDTKTGLPYKLSNDTRITRVGRFIRKTSLDELPQFWNVLLGDMSLVGPRPPVRYEVEHYSDREWQRLAIKPGLTGPWQVYGRSRMNFAQMIDEDLMYLNRQSLRYDIKLICLTVPVMLGGLGGA